MVTVVIIKFGYHPEEKMCLEAFSFCLLCFPRLPLSQQRNR